MYCCNCGAKLSDEQKFCHICGHIQGTQVQADKTQESMSHSQTTENINKSNQIKSSVKTSKKVKYILAVISLVLLLGIILLLKGSVPEKKKKQTELTEQQRKTIDIILRDIEMWNIDYIDATGHWPINRIYISEDDEYDFVFFTVGYLGDAKESGSMVSRVYLGVRSYAVTDKVYFLANGYLSSEWAANGIKIDLSRMSEEKIREILEKSYLNYVNSN